MNTQSKPVISERFNPSAEKFVERCKNLRKTIRGKGKK